MLTGQFHSPAAFFIWRKSPQWARASSFTRFLDHTTTHHTFGRTLLDKESARRRDFYLTTHNTHNRKISMPPMGFEPAISAGERPQTHILDPCHWDRLRKITSMSIQKKPGSVTDPIWPIWRKYISLADPSSRAV